MSSAQPIHMWLLHRSADVLVIFSASCYFPAYDVTDPETPDTTKDHAALLGVSKTDRVEMREQRSQTSEAPEEMKALPGFTGIIIF